MDALVESSRGLFGICVAAAVMDLLAGEGGASRTLRPLCALGMTICALRMVSRML